MKCSFLISSNEAGREVNIYADKSSLILDWLLREGIDRDGFSIREVSKEIEVSIGLIQRVFSTMVLKGFLQTEGIRTAKRFFFKNPMAFLESWLINYDITKKCKMSTYASALSGKAELLTMLKKSPLNKKIALALHSAASFLHLQNTNLNTLELYLLDPSIKPHLEVLLQLEPKEKGYDVLLLEPYYSCLLNRSKVIEDFKTSSILLTFLDLYHFPLRGQEQAEFLASHAPDLKKLFKSG